MYIHFKGILKRIICGMLCDLFRFYLESAQLMSQWIVLMAGITVRPLRFGTCIISITIAGNIILCRVLSIWSPKSMYVCRPCLSVKLCRPYRWHTLSRPDTRSSRWHLGADNRSWQRIPICWQRLGLEIFRVLGPNEKWQTSIDVHPIN